MILEVVAPHVKSQPTKFGDHRHCGSGYMMFLVAEKENSRFSRFNLLLLFNPLLLSISKGHGLKVHGIYY